MHVLMSESTPGAADRATMALEAAGHTIHRCHQPGATGVACSVLTDGSCPVEQAPIDVAVDVRPTSGPLITATEDGALCAARRRIPLVVLGPGDTSPYQDWAYVGSLDEEIAAGGVNDVVGIVTLVTEMPLDSHGAAATAVLRKTLGDPASTARVLVHRRDGGLRATILTDDELSPAVKAVAATRVAQALRTVDRWAHSLDVSFERSDPT